MSRKQEVKTRTPSLRVLSFTLQNKELWPKDFFWDYSFCSSCAMGMARDLWPDAISRPGPGEMSDAFKLGPGIAMSLFTGAVEKHKTVTPEIVADRIDRYLANE